MRTLLAAALLLSAAACAAHRLPPELEGKVEVIEPGDPQYSRANPTAAQKPAGEGGVSKAIVVKILQPIPVWRMWNEPAAENRLGRWWSIKSPSGTRDEYRKKYAICRRWNELTHLTQCTLNPGAIAAVGPGNSVSAETSRTEEFYPENSADWQLYLEEAASLDCPPESSDYRPNPNDLTRPE